MDEGRLERLLVREEIADVLTRYALALDGRDWELLRTCFTPGAVADYGVRRGVSEGVDAIVRTCRRALGGLDASQHLIGTIAIEVDGDRASSTCYVQAQHALDGATGGSLFTVGGSYRDRLTRTGDGWRIEHRTLTALWTEGNPGVFPQAEARLEALGESLRSA